MLQFGNTPLHIAARTGSSSCVTTLLEAKASIKLKNAVTADINPIALLCG